MSNISKVKARLREYLQAKGIEISSNGLIHCPWHDDKNPSCKVNDDYVYCFACNESGDIFKVAATLIGIPHNKENFREIAAEVERTLGIPEWKPDKQALRSPLTLSKSVIFQNELLRDFARAIDAADFETAFFRAQLLFGLFMLPEKTQEDEPKRKNPRQTFNKQIQGYGIKERSWIS